MGRSRGKVRMPRHLEKGRSPPTHRRASPKTADGGSYSFLLLIFPWRKRNHQPPGANDLGLIRSQIALSISSAMLLEDLDIPLRCKGIDRVGFLDILRFHAR